MKQYKFLNWTLKFKNKNIYNKFIKSKRNIIISKHTNSFDVLLLDRFIKQIKNNVLTYTNWARLSNLFNINSEQIVRGGFVDRKIKELNKKDNYNIVIFPNGGDSTWKTGAFAISKETNSNIFIFGIDYYEQIVTVDTFLKIINIKKDMKFCKKKLSKYNPYTSLEIISKNKNISLNYILGFKLTFFICFIMIISLFYNKNIKFVIPIILILINYILVFRSIPHMIERIFKTIYIIPFLLSLIFIIKEKLYIF